MALGHTLRAPRPKIKDGDIFNHSFDVNKDNTNDNFNDVISLNADLS